MASRQNPDNIHGVRQYLDLQILKDDIELEDGSTVVDESNGHVPDSILQSTPKSAGDGLKSSSGTLNIEPADFAGNGVEDDGSDNLRVDGSAVAGNVLAEGTNPYEVDVTIGNGLEDNSGTLRVNPAGIAGDGLKETSATSLGVEPADIAGSFLSDDGSDNLQVDTGDGLEGDGSGNIKTEEPYSYDPGHTSWDTGLSNVEIARIVLQTGETLVVDRIEFRQKGGGSSTSASIDVRDTTAASTIGSQDLGGTTKNPGSSGSGNTVIVRVNNSTGSAIDAAPRVVGRIQGA